MRKVPYQRLCPSCDEYAMPEAWAKLEEQNARLVAALREARGRLVMQYDFPCCPADSDCLARVDAILAEIDP